MKKEKIHLNVKGRYGCHTDSIFDQNRARMTKNRRKVTCGNCRRIK